MRHGARRKIFCFGLCALLLTPGLSAEAQQPTKVSRIGYLSGDTLAASERRVEAFRQGLRDLGYVEGKNIVVEWRFGERLFERQLEVAVELARLKPDLVVAVGSGDIRAAKEANASIPIVMVNGGDRGRERFRRQSRSAGRQYYRVIYASAGTKRQTLRYFEGGRSKALARGGLRKHKQFGITYKYRRRSSWLLGCPA